MIFLLVIFLILLGCVVGIGWLSKVLIFGRLEPPFIGALVGAAGTIFAGCIAYSAASQNLEIARASAENAANQKKDFESQVAKAAHDRAAFELRSLRELQRF